MLRRLGAVALCLLPMPGAMAQGPVQTVMGTSASRDVPPSAVYRLPPGARPGVYRDLFEEDAPSVQPTYRSVCVRLCDGYYFPISFATTQSGLHADEEKCRASCSSEARLFFQASPGDDIGAARDFLGLQYELLPNAFKYRKTLVEGCRCKAQPWSAEEKQRHLRYAVRARKPAASAGAELPVVEIAAGERPLAQLRRAPPESARSNVPSPVVQDALQRPAPMAGTIPAPRLRPPAGYDFMDGARLPVYGLPPPPPRRR